MMSKSKSDIKNMSRPIPVQFNGVVSDTPLILTRKDLEGPGGVEMKNMVRWCDGCNEYHPIIEFLVSNRQTQGYGLCRGHSFWAFEDDLGCNLCYRHYHPAMTPIPIEPKIPGQQTPHLYLRILSLHCGNEGVTLYDKKDKLRRSIREFGMRAYRPNDGPPKHIRLQPYRMRSMSHTGAIYGKNNG